jgi:serine/threonine-protein kinase
MEGFTPPPTAALAPGDRLDRYELLCVLAQGGMGTVWLARLADKLGFERLVAVKTILPEYTQDEQFCAMFLDEAGIAARIDHENIARILEIGEDRGFLFYVMELIDGESMRKLYRDVRMQGQIFPVGVALRICADACAGLHAVHELRGPDGRSLEVIHRDVSPQNILITVRGTTKLIDFGVAKARERRTENTSAGTLKGKLEYMAPEQAAGEPIDRRADVYSIGAILYELLAGRPVRETDDGRQLLALHELVTGAPYPALHSNLPHLVRAVVDRALMRDPNLRYRTADEMRHALEQVILATGMSATIDDVAGVLAHFSRERTQKRKDAIDEAVRNAELGRLASEPVDDPHGERQEKTIVAPVSQRRIGGVRTGPYMPPYEGASGTGPYPVLPGGSGGVPIMPHVPPGAPPGDGPPTGPSIRTMEGASISAWPRGLEPPKPKSSTRVFMGALVIGLVGLLGVVAGVVIAKRGLPTFGEPPAVASPAPTPVPVTTSATPTPSPSPTDTAPPPVLVPPPVVTVVSATPTPASSSSSPPPRASASASASPPSTRPTPPATTVKPPVKPPPPPPGPKRIGGHKPEAPDSEYGF